MIPYDTIQCRDALEGMREIPSKSIDLIITDPPYGIGEAAGKNKSRSKAFSSKSFGSHNSCHKIIPSIDYGNLKWDNCIPSEEYFSEMFRISKNQIIFGGNFFNLPPSSCWIVWDKDNSGDFADAELAWTSFNSAVRIFKWRWNGMLQEDPSHKEKRIHPTQKPVPLFEWILNKYAKDGDLICDPFLGSGSSIVACVKRGYHYIGFEREKKYFNDANIRINKERTQQKLKKWFI